jgi:hypothetical protein
MPVISSEKQLAILSTGVILFVTKNLRDGQVIYDFAKGLQGMNDTISWTEQGKKTSKLVCQKFSQVVANLHREISFDHVDFIPYAPGKNYTPKGNLFNMFTRFKARLIDTEDFSPIEPLLAHLRNVLAAGCNDLFEYLANWLAHIMQKPREKLGTAIIFQAEQGLW